MIGGEAERRRARSTPIFAALAPGPRRRRRTPGREARRHRRARLPALRADRRRPLRQDGPQRHRVRPDGRLRRGPQHPAPRQRRQARARRSTPRRRRCATRVLPATTSTSPRSPSCGGGAAWSAHGCSTSPPQALLEDPELGGVLGPGIRLGRGPLDGRGRDRRGRPGPRAQRRPVRALRAPGARPTSPRRCCQPCATSSAATWSSRPVSDRGSGGLTPRPPGNGGLRIGSLEGESSVTLAAGDLEATFLPGTGLLGTSLRHRGAGTAGAARRVAGVPGQARHRPAPARTLGQPPARWRYQAAGSRSTSTAWTCPPTGRPADPRHPDRPAGLATGALGRRGGLGHAPGQPGLRRLPGAAGRVPVPPPADRDRHRPSGDLS